MKLDTKNDKINLEILNDDQLASIHGGCPFNFPPPPIKPTFDHPNPYNVYGGGTADAHGNWNVTIGGDLPININGITVEVGMAINQNGAHGIGLIGKINFS